MPGRRGEDVGELVEGARAGDVRSTARLISLVEEASPLLREAAALLAPYTGAAHVVGVTGAPGVGKSTATNALVAQLRSRGRRVAVLAIDPSSPFSGGALLGDRVRMGDHAGDDAVFIRSMAARGHLGGVAWATPQAVRVLDVAGYDVVLVETVGVGQSEVEIAGAADTTLVLLAPGMGDEVQAAKAGVLEIGDVYVVNKSDRDGAARTVRELRSMVATSARPAEAWQAPVVRTVATSGEGIAELVDHVESHREWLAEGERLRARRLSRARDEIEALALTALRERWHTDEDALDALAARVADGGTDPYTAADELSS